MYIYTCVYNQIRLIHPYINTNMYKYVSMRRYVYSKERKESLSDSPTYDQDRDPKLPSCCAPTIIIHIITQVEYQCS